MADNRLDFITQIKNKVWGGLGGSLSDQADLKSALDGKQPLDADLTAIAALAPADDSIIQRKSGAWTNRTMAQLATDLIVIEKNANDIFRVNAPGGAMRWSGTISSISANRLSVTVSAPVTGKVTALVPASTSQLAKLRVYNSTRANNYGLISNYNVTTSVVTLTAAAPANWVNGDTLTITSPVVSGDGQWWADLEMVETSLLNRGAIYIVLTATAAVAFDTGLMHPYDASYSVSKREQAIVPAANAFAGVSNPVKWIDNCYSIALQQTWTGASDAFFIRTAGYIK